MRMRSGYNEPVERTFIRMRDQLKPKVHFGDLNAMLDYWIFAKISIPM